jgi:hypothetical protein
MKLPRRAFLHLAASAAAVPAVSRIAQAQTYPTRPVRVIVPAPAGGGYDIVARLMSQFLSERLGQQFIVENRPGGGTNIGTETVVRAAADGYTLLLLASANAINATLYDKLNFNFIRDIAAVAAIISLARKRCQTLRPSLSSCQDMRRASGTASAHRRPRRPRSWTSSTRKSMQASPIPSLRRGLASWAARFFPARPRPSASSSLRKPRSGATSSGPSTSRRTDAAVPIQYSVTPVRRMSFLALTDGSTMSAPTSAHGGGNVANGTNSALLIRSRRRPH